MIHHISIPAQNPLCVANALAKMFRGQILPFTPIPGSYIVMNFDEYGTAIEIYPLGTQLSPHTSHPNINQGKTCSQFTSFHIAISVPIEQKQIEEIANEEGWYVQLGDRNLFKVIEVWVENWLMFELLTPELVPHYLNIFTQPNNALKMFITPVAV